MNVHPGRAENVGHRRWRQAVLIAVALGVTGLGVAPAATAQVSIEKVEWIVRGPSLVDGFLRPAGIAADSARGILIVADTARHRLVLFDAKGRSRGSIPCDARMNAAGSCEPRTVAVDGRGRIYVLDSLGKDVQVMTPTGSRLAHFDPIPDSVQTRPQHLVIGASGRLYVALAGERAGYAILSPKGKLLSTVGLTPEGPFRGPVAIAVNADESAIAVVDPEADRAVSVYGSDGQLLAAFGSHGEGDGTFSMASHVVWGPGNTLWVTDQIRHSISVFDRRGRYLGRFGGFGRGPGQFDYPAGIAFLAPNRIAVLERAGSRLQVLEMEVGNAWEPQTRRGSNESGSSGTFSFAEVDHS